MHKAAQKIKLFQHKLGIEKICPVVEKRLPFRVVLLVELLSRRVTNQTEEKEAV